MANIDQPDWIVPSTYVYNKLLQSFISTGGTSVSVGAYAAVEIVLGNVDNVTPHVAVYQFVDGATGNIIESGLLSSDSATGNPLLPSWSLPVVADTLKLFSSANSLIAEVYGTNQELPKRLSSDTYPARTLTATIPASSPANTRVQFLGQDDATNGALPQTNLTNYNGPVTYSYQSSPSNITGDIDIQFLDRTGTRKITTWLQGTSTTTQRFTLGHPYAFASYSFLCTTISPASIIVVTLTLVPQTPMR